MNVNEVFNKLKEESKNKVIELGKEYYVSEWSWNTMCDGYIVDKQTIRHSFKDENGEILYITGGNHRAYNKHDLWDTKEEADIITKIKNSYSYDWKDNAYLPNWLDSKINTEHTALLNSIGEITKEPKEYSFLEKFCGKTVKEIKQIKNYGLVSVKIIFDDDDYITIKSDNLNINFSV